MTGVNALTRGQYPVLPAGTGMGPCGTVVEEVRRGQVNAASEEMANFGNFVAGF